MKVNAKTKDDHQDKPRAMRNVSPSNFPQAYCAAHDFYQPSKSKAMKVTVKKSLDKVQEYSDINVLTRAHHDISKQWCKEPCWTCAFLPTLTHVLYNSERLFTD